MTEALETFFRAYDFLVHEAELLDQRRFDEWLEVLDPTIVYRMPVRESVDEGLGDGSSDTMFHFDETYSSLRTRVARAGTESAWSERPPSRTRRLVTNVRARQGAPGSLEVDSCLLLVRERWGQHGPSTLTVARRDILREHELGLRLASRRALVDQTSIRMVNLAVFV